MKLFLFIIVVIIILYWWYSSKNSDVDSTKTALKLYLPEVFIVADIETTGLDPEKHEIIEIAAIRAIRDSDNHSAFTELVKSSKKIPNKITEITGITNEMIQKDGKPLEEVLKQFFDFIGDERLVFYNAPFDMSFLEKATKQIGVDIKNLVSDALKIAKKAWPNKKSYKLAELASEANLKVAGHHRALKDCELTLGIFCAAAITAKKI